MARIDANGYDILRLLKDRGTVYVIPKYQRSYAWETQPEITNFWDDIYETVVQRNEELFTGSIIISDSDKALLDGVQEVNFYLDVIDGQQRLTTVIILLRALYDSVSAERKNWAYTNIYEPYFLVGIDGEKRLRLSKEDKRFFDDFILDINNLNAPARQNQKPSEKRLQKALQFFRSKIVENSGENRDLFIENFLNKIKDNLSIVLIKARDDVDAYTIFETINSKNRALTPSELLKNYFFSAVSSSSSLLTKISEQWESITDQDIDITEYIRHYWISAHEGKISEKRLYRTIKDEIKRDQDKVKYFISCLKTEAHMYNEITNPSSNYKNDFDQYLIQLKELGIKQCYPLILALRAIGYNNIAIVLKEIIFVSLRRSISDMNPNQLENLYSDFSYKIRTDGPGEVDKFLEQLKSKDVDNDDFINHLKNAPLSQKIAKFILLRLEEATATGEKRLHPQDVEVEHIMPRSPEKLTDWNVNPEEHKTWLETIGNKTLVGPTFNKEMSNKNFAIKKSIYAQSEMKITVNLSREYSSWGPVEIEKRAVQLGEDLNKIYR